MSFPFVKQPDAMDCGPACLKMIAGYYKVNHSLESLRKKCYITREGVSFLGLSEAADSIGFRTIGVKIPFGMLNENVPLPCIVHWKQKHFVVVYKIRKEILWVADPGLGLIKYKREEFVKNWAATTQEGEPAGLVLILEPTPAIFRNETNPESGRGFGFLYKYFRIYQKYSFQLILGLILASCIQLVIPFLTQSVIDIGLNNNDLGFIYLILFAQLALVLGRMSVEFIRGWLLLHIGSRVNVAVISDFLQKLMSMPVSFFETKLTGDILQRIEDNSRIEDFLTSASLSIMFSFFNLIVFGIVLAIYSLKILLIFLSGAALYILWVSLFMKSRARLDHLRFRKMSESGSKLINIVNGMQEIKLTQSELSMRWDWEKIQASLFSLKVKGLSIIQFQSAGATLINEVTNIFITIIAATAVLKGDMTLGMMLAVQFITGQLNVPLSQMIGFFKMSQDAKISLDRLSEVHHMENEEANPEAKVRKLPVNKDIFVNNISFQYEGPHSPFALKDIDLFIEGNKKTAIVGSSGSGKTTLLKMLLGFYQPVNGEIMIGDTRLSNISLKLWRNRVGAVMQDGFIFPDTIAANIAPGSGEMDEARLVYAAEIANIRGFVESLPLGYNTKVGANGHGLSEGQKQRLLIARVVYKDPDVIVFDEATNSLDAYNEKVIVENLTTFFDGKTVIIVAHRLSTVKNADKIVVIDNGRIVETGTHNSLIEKRGVYFNLVKNQLELGN
ncbi:MAG: ABC transporter ATP-binding protein [Bacteroidetes bacterium GWE2_41_25]|nr:MAG: ABC transporter ATP-binding protein [Bacteroidetes bacterium GWA2_40_15]OFX93301.1 MAG: ABC transporter ATP-binding protein [Bacteroidetes bacterium GWC2_40_22]OFY13455.1 MAG: ABC transporter ATP-binding protein [Bacteroidetes bacterium GWE2_41_25]OFY59148.1 MAG: ABC transporter ATP-binding protein [Bacteroidetes bacterium GWF2_41_9]HBH83709.1 ABC transporter ATP-binding protein [Bacteroidales bacterium]